MSTLIEEGGSYSINHMKRRKVRLQMSYNVQLK